ncbi:hypothetical protein PIROE2DRAFT_10503 [Piromyces sp. E2]|nr:hypothetical protein PIROE2DRAFT_10503 [Piromyces sp. E2]|eukprot:OUM63035.1 hypothetical protein PIROE2DRAFT_10503 [Piromyces sp. E2]
MDEKENTNHSVIDVGEFKKENEIKNQNNPGLNKRNSVDSVNVQLSRTKFHLVIMSLIISLIISSLDISIVATALPTISNQFHSKDNYTWVITAYMLSKTSFQPIADIFGRRPVMIVVLILFVGTSAICGAATNTEMLIVFRGIQGIGGGSIMAMTNIIISDIVPLRKRGMYMGISGAVFAFSSVIGPLIGGIFTDQLSYVHNYWRWAFYINIPIGFVAIIVIALYVNIPTPPGSMLEKIKRIDFLGTFLLVSSVVSLLLGLSWGRTKYSWSSAYIILLFIGFVIGLSFYLIVEWKVSKEPITPFQIFKNKNVCFSCLISFFLGITFIGFTNTAPLLYQDGRGISATYSGLRIVPHSVTVTIGNIGSGYLIGKYGYIERYMKTGSFTLIISSYFVTYFGINSPYIFEFFVLSLFGLSVGLNMQNCVLVTQQSSDKKFLAIGTTLINFFRLIGGVMGITLVGVMLSNKFPRFYAEKYPGMHVTVNDIHNIPNGEEIYVDAILSSYETVLFASAIITFIFTLFLSGIPVIGNRKKLNKKRNEEEEKIKSNNINIEEKKDVEISINTSDTHINTHESYSTKNSIAISDNTTDTKKESKSSVEC